MSQSTEADDADHRFAVGVIRELLTRAVDAVHGNYRLVVTHAWAEGPFIHLVYLAPPSDITWGLVRDVRESIIEPGPWSNLDEAAQYYYLLDLQEGWPGAFSRQTGEPDTIRWIGDLRPGLPNHTTDIPDQYRRPTRDTSVDNPMSVEGQTDAEPRRYLDPN